MRFIHRKYQLLLIFWYILNISVVIVRHFFFSNRFELLESGKYPSLDDIKEMYKDGFDFLEYENSIIIPEYHGYETIE